MATATGAGPTAANSSARLRQGAALLLTAPGVPFLYYGEEVGTVGEKPDEQLRLPLAWDATATGGFTKGKPYRPLPADAKVRNVATQRTDPASVWSAYRDLIALRAKLPALRAPGSLPIRSQNEAVAAWLRTDGNQTVAVIHNLTDRPIRPVLSAKGGVPRGAAKLQWGAPGGTAVTAPTPDAKGAIEGWTPIPELGPRMSLVIELGQ